jgi:hypothetical protein
LCNGLDDDSFDDGVVDDGCAGGPDQAGVFSEAQFEIGTGSLDPCGNEGWPLDLASAGISANRFNISDLGSFVAPLRRLGSRPGDEVFNSRWDLVPGNARLGSAWINIVDLAASTSGLSGFPPMLGGIKAMNQSCPFPP